MARSGSATLDEVMAGVYAEEGLEIEDILGTPAIIPTGILGLDYILGIGGWPRGRTVELSGLSQSGKTTVAATAAAQAQRMGLPVVYIDYEQSLDEPYLRELGVDVDDRKLFIPYPARSLEAGMAAAHKAAGTGKVGLIIHDSVAAMSPQKNVDESGDDRTMAMNRARILGGHLAPLNSILARTGTCAIYINHLRDVIETGPSRPGLPQRKTTPGGSALKFYASIRCEFAVVKTFKHDRYDALTGMMVTEPHAVFSRVRVTKNKLAAPYREACLYLRFGQGFNNTHTAMTVLVAHGIVKQSGAYYYFPTDLYHAQMKSGTKGDSLQGLQSVMDLAEFDPEWASRLELAARNQLALVSGSEVVEAVEAVDEIAPAVPVSSNGTSVARDTVEPPAEPVGQSQEAVPDRRVRFIDETP